MAARTLLQKSLTPGQVVRLSHDAQGPSQALRRLSTVPYSSSRNSSISPSCLHTTATVPRRQHRATTGHDELAMSTGRLSGWSSPSTSQIRSYHATTALNAKGSKKKTSKEAEKWADEEGNDGIVEGKHPIADPADPINFADVESRSAELTEKFKERLNHFRAGGRFNPDAIGALPVTTNKATNETHRLRELGQVVPRGGRVISIILHEKTYVKPVMSAVQASEDFNQQPQRDPDNELELTLKIEPEQPEEVAKRIKTICLQWRQKLRLLREKRDRTHTRWRKEKLVTPDDEALADKKLGALIKAKISEVDALEKKTLQIAQVA